MATTSTDKNQCLDAPVTGDRHDLDPKLGPLQDNGGPTKTMAPLSGSPLIDGGPAICQGVGTPLTADQRGLPRGAVCDIGAYEAIPPAVTAPPSVGGSPVTGQTLTCVPATFSGDNPLAVDTVWLRDGQQTGHRGRPRFRPRTAATRSLAGRPRATRMEAPAPTARRCRLPPARHRGRSAAKLSKLKIKPKTLHHKTKAKVTFTLSAPAKVTFKICKRQGQEVQARQEGRAQDAAGQAGRQRPAVQRQAAEARPLPVDRDAGGRQGRARVVPGQALSRRPSARASSTSAPRSLPPCNAAAG